MSLESALHYTNLLNTAHANIVVERDDIKRELSQTNVKLLQAEAEQKRLSDLLEQAFERESALQSLNKTLKSELEQARNKAALPTGQSSGELAQSQTKGPDNKPSLASGNEQSKVEDTVKETGKPAFKSNYQEAAPKQQYNVNAMVKELEHVLKFDNRMNYDRKVEIDTVLKTWQLLENSTVSGTAIDDAKKRARNDIIRLTGHAIGGHRLASALVMKDRLENLGIAPEDIGISTFSFSSGGKQNQKGSHSRRGNVRGRARGK